MLIGVISIAFEEATEQIKEERMEAKCLEKIMNHVELKYGQYNDVLQKEVEGFRVIFSLIGERCVCSEEAETADV